MFTLDDGRVVVLLVPTVERVAGLLVPTVERVLPVVPTVEPELVRVLEPTVVPLLRVVVPTLDRVRELLLLLRLAVAVRARDPETMRPLASRETTLLLRTRELLVLLFEDTRVLYPLREFERTEEFEFLTLLRYPWLPA